MDWQRVCRRTAVSYTHLDVYKRQDLSMMREFVRMVGEGKTGKTDASVSVVSHLMALAAEEARISRSVIDFEEYSTYEMK